MINKLLLLTALIRIFISPCIAQTNIIRPVGGFFLPNQEHFKSIVFTASVSNNFITYNTANFLKCRVQNLSTNAVGLWGGHDSLLYCAVLKNNTGQIVNTQLIQSANPPSFSMPIYMRSVEAGEACEWTVPIVINERNKPGRYQIEAYEGVFSTNSKYAWHLTSNLVDLYVDKKQ